MLHSRMLSDSIGTPLDAVDEHPDRGS